MGLVCMVMVALAAVASDGTGAGTADSRSWTTAPDEASSKPAQGSSAISAESTSSSAAEENDGEIVVLQCEPVAAYWTGPPQSDGMPLGPSLAVVSVETRPKDARVHLDGRFVGRARYLDGKPGYLYLEPGAYRLELCFEGYRTVKVSLEATAGCKYTLKHYMERMQGVKKEKEADLYGKGMPFERVFGPQTKKEEPGGPAAAAGPDLSLRRDLGSNHGGGGSTGLKRGASLRLDVAPKTARVTLDGVFVATAWELSLMEGPLATTAGPHLIEVQAEGFVGVSRQCDLETGEELALQIVLSEKKAD